MNRNPTRKGGSQSADVIESVHVRAKFYSCAGKPILGATPFNLAHRSVMPTRTARRRTAGLGINVLVQARSKLVISLRP